ncbi:hypothetical protein [Pseudoxanthomonas indica]|uniref:hypothetical protein n=1 Tax=Pseudoxanthomonas indica TaxID=428993 RepID=UPI00166F4298|nr:hypothetical protein [Pseudoxanthomonas indica]
MNLLAAAFCLLGSVPVSAQDTYEYTYEGTYGQGKDIESLASDGLFGDRVSYIDGGVSFQVIDVAAKTNVKLPLQFGRLLRPFAPYYADSATLATDRSLILGTQWRADIPYVAGIYRKNSDFYRNTRPRCSVVGLVPQAQPVQGRPPILQYNFWYGVEANIPGYGRETLWPIAANSPVPSSGGPYRYSTMSHWRVSCLPALKNATGEGFKITLPDGASYDFDWLALRPVTPFTSPYGGDAREEMYFMASKATDRFGNTVTYEYDPSFPTHVTRMLASDGAEIRINYGSDGRVSTVTDGTSTWQYVYAVMTGMTTPELSQVILPDGSKWQLSLPQYIGGQVNLPTFGYQCNFSPGQYTSAGDSARMRQTFVHPSGAVGEFTYKVIALGYNNVAYGSCNSAQPPEYPQGRPKAFLSNPLISKMVSGPGITPLMWTLTYAPSWSYATECASGCPSTSTTTVVKNDGSTTTYVFGNDAQVNANQLLSESVSSGGITLTRTDYKYLASVTGQAFPDYVTGVLGAQDLGTLANEFFRRNRPMYERTIVQDGRAFKYKVDQFDAFARPVATTKSSAPAP